MKAILIKVECHSGYKADEYPACFYWKDEKFEIREISDRWYQGNRNPEYPVANYFKVTTIHERQYLIKHEIKSNRWFLISPAH
jgi:hypothetical protein